MFLKNTHKQFLFGTGFSGAYFLVRPPAAAFLRKSAPKNAYEVYTMVEAKILIADDSKMNQQILSEILGDRYEYLYADDGMQALEHLHSEFDIDLLLLDINMPRLDGFGVLEVMKQRNWLQEIPVIIISSEDDESFIQKAYDLGVTDYIRRPFNLTVTQRRVSNALTLYARQKHLVHLAEEQVYEREKTNSAIINILSHVVESRNFESGTHILHVRAITDILLRQLVAATNHYPLSQADISMISTLSALHDIGKISIPAEILNKPGKLTREEFEIMKTHTTAGDELLQDMPVSHDDPLMRTAHEICRWHHERWDGRGYPDGLKGDEIPISAQVVALADVYDALTSDRCYKKAFSHETAMQMILNGECGAFNPLLLECFSAVSDTLHENLQHEPSEFDYRLESHRLSTEMLEQHSLPTDNRELHLLPLARANAAFFAEQSGGIQFTYDRWMNKVTYTNWDADEAHRQQTLYLNEGDTVNLLDHETHDALVKRVRQTTPAQPDVTMPVTLHIGGEDKPYTLTVRTVWLPGDGAYSCALGQFVPEGGKH